MYSTLRTLPSDDPNDLLSAGKPLSRLAPEAADPLVDSVQPAPACVECGVWGCVMWRVEHAPGQVWSEEYVWSCQKFLFT